LDYSQSPGIDLHIHSTASDGTLTPTEILDSAHRLGLVAISITDHDTVAGCRAALNTKLPDGLGFITGVEISAAPPPFYPLSGSIHMLGYGIDLNNARLNGVLEALQDSRLNRNPRIISRLNALGLSVTMEEVLSESANPNLLGRPHIARALVKKGYVPNFDAAFDTFLGNDRPAYVDKYRVPFDEAIATIKAAGGIPVIAHPGIYAKDNGLMTNAAVASFKAAGIGGIEVYYPEHSPRQIAHYTALANRHGLLKTGGTDFHGDMKPEVAMGAGYGDLHVPADLYTRLTNALAG
jgi:predicted metal-dependent phosphoesterase TrpH